MGEREGLQPSLNLSPVSEMKLIHIVQIMDI
jgi:hypothetical protein